MSGYTSREHGSGGETDPELRLFLVVKQGCVLTVAELVDYLSPRLPPDMLPRYYDVLAQMPTGVSGRIITSELAGRPLGPDTVGARQRARSTNPASPTRRERHLAVCSVRAPATVRTFVPD
jgi:hypothetical protein